MTPFSQKIAVAFAVLAATGGGVWREFFDHLSQIAQATHSVEEGLTALKDGSYADLQMRHVFCTTAQAIALGRPNGSAWEDALDAAGVDTANPVQATAANLDASIKLARNNPSAARSFVRECAALRIVNG